MRASEVVGSRALVAASSVLVIALAVVIAVRLFGGEGSADVGRASAAQPSAQPPASPSASPTVRLTKLPDVVPSAAPRLDAKQKAAGAVATTRLVSFLAKSSAALARNDGKAAVAAYADGPALGEIQSLALQYDNEHMTVRGTPKVLGSKVVAADLSSKPQSMTVAVCLDNSPVIVRDVKGRNLSKHRRPSELKVLNLYELQKTADDWLVVNHSIPADSSCKQLKQLS